VSISQEAIQPEFDFN